MSPAQIVAIAGVVALAVMIVATARLFRYPPPAAANSNLNGREQALVSAVADAFFPPNGPIPLSGCEAGLLEYFDKYLARFSRPQRLLVRLLLAFTELGPLLFGPRRSRFTQLSHGEQLRFLDTAFISRIYFRRVAFISLRAVMTMGYLANDEVAKHMGMAADADPFGLGAQRDRNPRQQAS